MYNAFKNDIEFNNKKDNKIKDDTIQGGDFNETNDLHNKQNPLLDKPENYTVDKTGNITIINMTEWIKKINEIKNDIKKYESSEQYSKDICKNFNRSHKQDKYPKHLSTIGGRILVRTVISERKYNKEKNNKNKQVSRYKLKSGDFVHYIRHS